MLFSSSKRALSSIETATCLPFSAARTSARTASAFEPARYSVILIASTCGSSRRGPEEVEHRRKRVVGVVQQDVLLAMTANRSLSPARSGEVRGVTGGSRRSGRASEAIGISADRPSGPVDS